MTPSSRPLTLEEIFARPVDATPNLSTAVTEKVIAPPIVVSKAASIPKAKTTLTELPQVSQNLGTFINKKWPYIIGALVISGIVIYYFTKPGRKNSQADPAIDKLKGEPDDNNSTKTIETNTSKGQNAKDTEQDSPITEEQATDSDQQSLDEFSQSILVK